MGKLTVKGVKAETRPGKYGDGAGLLLFIKPNGTKFWLFRYARNGREHALGLGPVRDVGLHEAREAAADARKALRAGRNLIAEKRTARIGSQTFESFAREFHKTQGPKRNLKWYRQWLRELELHAFDKIGALSVAAVDTPAVLSVLTPLWQSKYVTAKRLGNTIERILNAAQVQKLRSGDNPARWDGYLEHLLPKREATAKKHLAALPWREMPDFMVRLRAPSGTLNLDALALELLILTAARTNEVRFAT